MPRESILVLPAEELVTVCFDPRSVAGILVPNALQGLDQDEYDVGEPKDIGVVGIDESGLVKTMDQIVRNRQHDSMILSGFHGMDVTPKNHDTHIATSQIEALIKIQRLRDSLVEQQPDFELINFIDGSIRRVTL